MARIRTVKPEFFHSKKLARCSPRARLLFAALMQLADREGRLRWIPMQVHAHAFPYEPVDISALVDELTGVGSLMKYAHGDDEFLWLPRFTIHQRVKQNEAPSRLPEPPSADTSSDGAQREPTVRTEVAEAAHIGSIGIGNREQGTGNREQGTGSPEGASAPVSVSSKAVDAVWASWRALNTTARKTPTAGQRKTIRARLKEYSVEDLDDYFRWLREAPHKRAVFCRTEGHDGFKSTMLPGNCDERMPWVAEWTGGGSVVAPVEAPCRAVSPLA